MNQRGKRQFIGILLSCIVITMSACTKEQKRDETASGTTNQGTNQVISEEKTTVLENDVEMNKQTKEVDYSGKTTLTYIGHASVKIKSSDGLVIYIDPNYSADAYNDEADYLLITHSHSDHQPCNALKKKENCVTITHSEALVDGEYQTFEYDNVKIEAVPAGNNPNHDVANGVGYIVTVDGISIYHAGDTSSMNELLSLADKKIDYAMYPIDGSYNMDAQEATELANSIGATHNIPIHEMDVPGGKKTEKFTPEGKLVLAYGETIVVEGELLE